MKVISSITKNAYINIGLKTLFWGLILLVSSLQAASSSSRLADKAGPALEEYYRQNFAQKEDGLALLHAEAVRRYEYAGRHYDGDTWERYREARILYDKIKQEEKERSDKENALAEEAKEALYEKTYKNRSTLRKMGELGKLVAFWPVAMNVLCHEFGHAVMGKKLTGDPIRVHFGAQPKDVPETLMSEKMITFHSFDPLKGGFAHGPRSYDGREEVMVLMAGPLAGLVTSIMRIKALNFIATQYSTHKNNLSLVSLYKMLVYVCMASEFVYGLTPFSQPGGDGYRLYQLLGLPKKMLDKGGAIGTKHVLGVQRCLPALFCMYALISNRDLCNKMVRRFTGK